MNDCTQMQEAISRLLDGELSAGEETALRAHIGACPECRALYETFSAVSEELRGDLAEPPESLRENLMAALRREAVAKRSRVPWRVLVSAAAVAALVLGLRFALAPLQSREMLGAAMHAGGTAAVEERSEAEMLEERASLPAAGEPAEAGADLAALLDYLAGEPFEGELPAGEPLARFALPGGTLSLYESEGGLCYRDPVSGALLRTARSLAQIMAFSEN